MNQCLGYLLTFTCYGTWLHGRDETSVDRYHNIYGAPRLDPNNLRKQADAQRLKHQSVYLNAQARSVVELSVREVCAYRDWYLHAVMVRTNHVHVVVSAPSTPETVMQPFKGYATRALREHGLFNSSQTVWTRHGSTRYLWKPEHLQGAIAYVMESQGSELPNISDSRPSEPRR